jgi:hypothetical protein
MAEPHLTILIYSLSELCLAVASTAELLLLLAAALL